MELRSQEADRPIKRLKFACRLIVRPAKFLLREEQLDLKAKGPGAALVRCNDIVEGLNVGIHRLATEVHNLAASTTHRYSPLIPRGRFPIRCDDGRAGKIPAVRHVVIQKTVASGNCERSFDLPDPQSKQRR
jgi:hypothetical protein